jgi:hypothetical protein
MKYLKPVIAFHVELPESALLIAVKGYKFIKGAAPSTYGDIMNEFSEDDDITLESLSFRHVFEEIMTKNKFFMKDKALLGKEFFFLREDFINKDYRWTHILDWEMGKYATTSENPNGNYFIESWRNESDRKHLLENSIFFVIHSKKELSLKNIEQIICGDCGEKLTTQEIMSKVMSIGQDDSDLNSQKGKAYCEKCKQKSYSAGTFVGDW